MAKHLQYPFQIKRFAQPQDYTSTLQKMQNFTRHRDAQTPDQIWLMAHPAVFTLGVQTDPKHLLSTSAIPVIQSDRGGQVTYHGPGQLMCYVMMDLRRANLHVHQLVDRLELLILAILKHYAVDGHTIAQQRGVYVSQRKIASLGLRCKRFCSYHGFALNVDMDLSPFAQINPCGYEGLKMITLQEASSYPNVASDIVEVVQATLLECFATPCSEIL